MGDSTTTTSGKTAQQTSPWAPQASQITNAFTNAQDIFDNRMASGPYTGNYVAGQNAGQQETEASALGYTQGQGAAAVNSVGNTANSYLNGTSQYDQNAAQLAQGTAGPNAANIGELNGAAAGQGTAISGGLTTALNGAAIAGANNIAGYNTQLNNAINEAATDPTQQLATDAGQYMNSSPIQQALQQANGAIDHTLTTSTLPGLNQAASINGGENSSRAGAIQGADTYNAALAVGNADSSIDNNAFNTGLSTAANERNVGLSAQLSGAENGISENAGIAENQQANNLATQNMQNNAATSALGSTLGYEGLNAQTQLAGNAQLAQGTELGLNAASEGQNLAEGNYQLGAAAGGLQQQGAQEGLTNQYDQWQGQNTYQQGVLDNYYGVVGASNWGGNTTGESNSTQTQQANPFTTVLGGALGAASLFAGGPSGSSGGGLLSNLFGGGGQNPWSEQIPTNSATQYTPINSTFPSQQY